MLKIIKGFFILVIGFLKFLLLKQLIAFISLDVGGFNLLRDGIDWLEIELYAE